MGQCINIEQLLETDPEDTYYGMAEVKKHNTVEDGWMVIGDGVYDVTDFIDIHPGAADVMINTLGTNATDAFEDSGHSEAARDMLEEFKIGKFDTSILKERRISMLNRFSIIHKALTKKQPMLISKIFIYPVKGCSGIEIKECNIVEGGILNDRSYAFVDIKENKVVNQLRFPKLCLIKPELDKIMVDNTSLSLSCEGMTPETIHVPVCTAKSNEMEVDYGKSNTMILAHDQGKEASEWITTFLQTHYEDCKNENKQFRLIRVSKHNVRPTPDYFQCKALKNTTMSGVQNYADVCVASQESLDELNARNQKLGKPSMQWPRFRINLIFKNVPVAHFEDFMKRIVIENNSGASQPQMLWSRRRYFCAVPANDQKTGEITTEPIDTLRSYRNAVTLDDRSALPGDSAVFFGDFFLVSQLGHVYVGDHVKSLMNLMFTEPDEKMRKNSTYYGLESSDDTNKFFDDFSDFKLVKKTQVNHDSWLFQFNVKLAHWSESEVKKITRFEVGDHVSLRCKGKDGRDVYRPYTPINDVAKDGFVELLVKLYKDGKMSQFLDAMEVGENEGKNTILMRKKGGRIAFEMGGIFKIGPTHTNMRQSRAFRVSHVNMIAGGSGITPMYQILRKLSVSESAKEDKVIMSLIFANKAEEDILLREELETIAKEFENIHVHFTLSRPKEGTQDRLKAEGISIGRVSAAMLKEHMCLEKDKALTLLCGPPPMHKAVKQMLLDAGLNKNMVFEY